MEGIRLNLKESLALPFAADHSIALGPASAVGVAGPYPAPAGYFWDSVVSGSNGDPVVSGTNNDPVVTLKRAA